MRNPFKYDFEGYLASLSASQNVNEPITTRLMVRARQVNDTNNEESPALDESGSEREFNDESQNNAINDDSEDECVHVHHYHPSRNKFLNDEASESGGETFSDEEEGSGPLLNAAGDPFIVDDDASLGHYSIANNSSAGRSLTNESSWRPSSQCCPNCLLFACTAQQQ